MPYFGRPFALARGPFYYAQKVKMSNSEAPNENKKSLEPDPNAITWEELERLEAAAEGGDTGAQKKLAELEGVESYEEYKQLSQQMIIDIDPNDNSGIQSILRSISGTLGPLSSLDTSEINKLMGKANTFGDRTEIESAAKTLLDSETFSVRKEDLQKWAEVTGALSERISDQDDLIKAAKDANRVWMNELKNTFPRNEIFMPPNSGSDAFLVSYRPRLEEQIAEEISENTRVNREILEEMRKQRIEKMSAKQSNSAQNIEQVEHNNFDVFKVKGWSRNDVYSHLFALVNNRNDLAIVKYQNQTEDDLERIIISDLKALDAKGETEGCVIGTVRLLPAGSDTVIQFVHKDLFWNLPVINPDLWRIFIQVVKEYLTDLQVAQDVLTPTSEKPKQIGRYRLTEDEVKRRKKIVKDANRFMRESNYVKTWKQIAIELDIPERTLRDWRHNPIYQ
jgi:hypothetical protein